MRSVSPQLPAVNRSLSTGASAQRNSVGAFITGRADEQMGRLTSQITGLAGSGTTVTTRLLGPGGSQAVQTTLTAEQGGLILAQATADRVYIGAAVTAGNAFGSALQGAQSALRSSLMGLSETARSAESAAGLAYSRAATDYIQSVDSTIENALSEFTTDSIGADQQQANQSNSAMGTAMRGMVSAEGDSQKALSNATQQWSRGIANAYQGAAQNGALFPVAQSSSAANSQVAGLYASLRAGGTIDHAALESLDPTHPGEEGKWGRRSTGRHCN